MSDFTAFFPNKESLTLPPSFMTLDKLFRTHLHAKDVQAQLIEGAALLVTQSAHKKLQFYINKSNSGWIIVKGIIFDSQTSTGQINPNTLLDCFLHENLSKLNFYEGSFALAAWDATRKKGWFLNDQASVMNLYYGEYLGGLYVSTNALTLARALNLSLDPHSMQEFLATGVLLAPATMFSRLKRVNIGEHLSYHQNTLKAARHWCCYADEVAYRNIPEAAKTIIETIVDRTARYTSFGSQRAVCDLTGGLDSRVLLGALMASSSKFGLTVNGSEDMSDVQIAKEIADKIRHSINHFDTTLLFDAAVTPFMRQELTYRTGGELFFNEIYPHSFTRPSLAERFDLHINGSGGELLRYAPWSQEFLGIGQHKLANIGNVLKYHSFGKDKKTFHPELFFSNWLPSYENQLYHQMEAICLEQPHTRTTQQLDAVYIWNLTSHSSLYLSSVYNWLPSVAPLLTAGVIKLAVSVPWQMRLTTQLQRQIIYQLSPIIAGVITSYGGTAEPTGVRNIQSEIRQTLRQTGHLVNKLENVLFHGMVSKYLKAPTVPIKDKIPFITPEFRTFLHPNNMFSRGMYQKKGLENLLAGNDETWRNQTSLILKLATVEQLCRELEFQPDASFLNVS